MTVFSMRPLQNDDEVFLWKIIYYAAHMEEENAPFEAAKEHPYVSQFVRGWGREGDIGVCAADVESNLVIGAAWLRKPVEGDILLEGADPTAPELALAVLLEHQGRGIGGALLTQIIDLARPHYPQIVLSVRDDNPAQRLYNRFGFTTINTITNRIGKQSLVMALELAPITA